MKKSITCFTLIMMMFALNLSANSPHCGTCDLNPCECGSPYSSCEPYDPCAPICGTDCGISICSIAAAVAAVVGVAAIIIASPGSSSVHTHNP